MIVLRSIIIILVISLIGSAICKPVFDIGYIQSFTLILSIQLIIGIIISAIRESLAVVQIKKLQLEELSELSKQGFELTCAKCNHLSFVPIRLDEHNTFTCPSCNQDNVLYIDIKVAQTTGMKITNTISQTDDSNITIR